MPPPRGWPIFFLSLVEKYTIPKNSISQIFALLYYFIRPGRPGLTLVIILPCLSPWTSMSPWAVLCQIYPCINNFSLCKIVACTDFDTNDPSSFVVFLRDLVPSYTCMVCLNHSITALSEVATTWCLVLIIPTKSTLKIDNVLWLHPSMSPIFSKYYSICHYG